MTIVLPPTTSARRRSTTIAFSCDGVRGGNIHRQLVSPRLSRSHTRDLCFFFFFSTRFSLFFRFFAGGSAAAGAGALLFLICSHRCSAADAVRRVPIAAAITSQRPPADAPRNGAVLRSSGVHSLAVPVAQRRVLVRRPLAARLDRRRPTWTGSLAGAARSSSGGGTGGTAAGGAAGAGAGGAADAVTSTAGLHLPPLQWLSVFFGNAAPQPGHVVRRLCTFKEHAGHVFIDGARLGLGLGAALARGGGLLLFVVVVVATADFVDTRLDLGRAARGLLGPEAPASVDVGFGAGGR